MEFLLLVRSGFLMRLGTGAAARGFRVSHFGHRAVSGGGRRCPVSGAAPASLQRIGDIGEGFLAMGGGEMGIELKDIKGQMSSTKDEQKRFQFRRS